MSIEVEGLNNILNVLDELGSGQFTEKGLEKAAQLVERAAREKAPKKTGELRRSITSKVEGQKAIIFTPLEYAPYVEYGTGLYAESGGRTDVPWAFKDEETGELIWTAGQKPNPYMRPALNENRNKIIEILKDGLKK